MTLECDGSAWITFEWRQRIVEVRIRFNVNDIGGKWMLTLVAKIIYYEANPRIG